MTRSVAQNKPVQPYVQEYRDTLRAIDAEYSAAREAAARELVTGKRGAERTAGETVYNTRERLLSQYAEAARVLARRKLALADPFAGWMMENAERSYPDHVRIVLDSLPVTVPELREISRRNAWCSEFDRLLSQAIRAGVLDGGHTAQFSVFITWVQGNLSINDRYVGYMIEQLELLITAERTAAVAQHQKEQAEKEVARKATAAEARAAKKASKVTVTPVDAVQVPDDPSALVTA